MGSRVLIMEDSKTVRAALVHHLLDAGYDPVCVEVFAELPERIRQLQPVALILDVNLPAISGEQIGLMLRRNHYQLPILIFSSEADARRMSVAHSIGASACVAKDEGVEALLQALERSVATVRP